VRAGPAPAAPPVGRDPLRLRLTGLGYRAAWRLARVLPEPWARRGFEASAALSWRRNARRRAVVRENLRPTVGDPAVLEETVRRAFLLYGRYWAETFRLPGIPRAAFEARFRVEGAEIIEDAYRRGRGVVLATPHLGNWDAGGRWVAERWPLAVVVEVLRPRALFERFLAHRRALGMTIIPLVPGGDVAARCVERVRAGELVALVADRALSRTGVPVQMFGRTTLLPPGPAVVSLRAGAPLVPACIYQTADAGWRGWVMEPIHDGSGGETPEAVAALTQRLAEAFERMIARDPAQWHAFTPVWTPERERSP
jgi:lauroyl/myristoyl acyltransferase